MHILKHFLFTLICYLFCTFNFANANDLETTWQKAHIGDVNAQYSLAHSYSSSDQVQADYELVVEWLPKAQALVPNSQHLNKGDNKSHALPYLSITLAWNTLNGIGTEQQRKQLFTKLSPNKPDALEQSYNQFEKLQTIPFKPPIKYSKPDASCGDYLHDFDENYPEYFVYSDCRIEDSRQGKPVEIIYTIEGKYAQEAEQYLIEKFGINPLKFLCCYWKTGEYPAAQQVNPKHNLHSLIFFNSEETLYTERGNWEKVKFYFSISVDREDI